MCFHSERDLLGDYEFNPFVDVELDYDENMEEGNEQSESQTMGMKKDEQEGEGRHGDTSEGVGGRVSNDVPTCIMFV